MKEPLAKPSGISIRQHITNVLAEILYIFESFPSSFIKYYEITGKNLFLRLNGAGKFHDDGKWHPDWRSACRKDYEEFFKWSLQTGKGFSEFRIANRNLAGKHLRISGIRHEINSLVRHINDGFSDPVRIAIAAHHNKLGRKFESKWISEASGIGSADIWKEIISINARYKNFHEFRNTVRDHYEFAAVRAYLQLADRRASSKEEHGVYIPFSLFEYRFPYNSKRNVQKIAEENIHKELLIIRASTGSGKTDAGMLWASLQIAAKKAERLVIAMPSIFTSNVLSINISENVSEIGLYHSSAWFSKFHKKVKDGILENDIARKEHELARQLLMPVTVCTIDHLLMALTLTKEDHHSIIFNLANSCVVIDEADLYDEFTQANILVLLEALHVLRVRVMIMSASIPDSFLSMYRSTGFDVKEIHEDTSDNTRVRCNIEEIVEYNNDLKEIEGLLEECLKRESVIIYANTVAKAMIFYRWFRERGRTPILYHSRFTDPDKAKKENALLSALNKKAWDSGIASGIAIMTQIGEVSVNISADLMLTDLCPADRLIQRVGRLCRFSRDRIGILKVLIPQKDDGFYPAPYGTFIRGKGWEPNKALIKTKELLEIKSYSAGDLVNLINLVYPALGDLKLEAMHNAELLKAKFVNNWIILPLETMEEDDTECSEWKSRDITPNDTVFVAYPNSNHFNSLADFNDYRLEYGIDIPVYLIKDGIKSGKVVIHKISIGEDIDIERIYISVDCYSPELGLQIGT